MHEVFNWPVFSSLSLMVFCPLSVPNIQVLSSVLELRARHVVFCVSLPFTLSTLASNIVIFGCEMSSDMASTCC